MILAELHHLYWVNPGESQLSRVGDLRTDSSLGCSRPTKNKANPPVTLGAL